jgi:mannose-1-phosphate guanylyltransferase
MITPVVMAGGTGFRLWPLSRQLNLKQFLKLCGDETLLQQILARLDGSDVNAPVII